VSVEPDSGQGNGADLTVSSLTQAVQVCVEQQRERAEV
jgi:hypothetical protein